MHKKSSSFKALRALALVFIVSATAILVKLVENASVTPFQLAYFFLNGAIMTGFLAWLVPKIRLGRWSLALLVSLELLIVEFLNNYVEAYFFVAGYQSALTLTRSVASALFSSLVAGMASALLLCNGAGGIAASLRELLSGRTRSSWALRIAIGSVAYFPVYFMFGALISPFILPYYSNPQFGLRIPSFTVIIPVEFFRGFVYTLTFLPLLATISGRKTRFIALAAMLYVPGGLIPLLGNASLPAPIVPFHLLEILADSLVYGFILSRILDGPRVYKP